MLRLPWKLSTTSWRAKYPIPLTTAVCSRKIICLLGVFLYPRLAHMLLILTSRYSFYSSPPCWYLELWPCSAAGQPPSNLWDQRDWPVETPLPWDRGETEAGWDKRELAVHHGTGPRSWVVLIPNLFLSSWILLHCMIIFCTQIVCCTTVTECVSSNWIELLMETETWPCQY